MLIKMCAPKTCYVPSLFFLQSTPIWKGIYTVQYNSTVKENEIIKYAGKWMQMEGTHAKKGRHCVLSQMWIQLHTFCFVCLT